MNQLEFKLLQKEQNRLAEILRKEGCCFGKESFTHKPDGICRCPEIQAALMINNTPGAAIRILKENS